MGVGLYSFFFPLSAPSTTVLCKPVRPSFLFVLSRSRRPAWPFPPVWPVRRYRRSFRGLLALSRICLRFCVGVCCLPARHSLLRLRCLCASVLVSSSSLSSRSPPPSLMQWQVALSLPPEGRHLDDQSLVARCSPPGRAVAPCRATSKLWGRCRVADFSFGVFFSRLLVPAPAPVPFQQAPHMSEILPVYSSSYTSIAYVAWCIAKKVFPHALGPLHDVKFAFAGGIVNFLIAYQFM